MPLHDHPRHEDWRVIEIAGSFVVEDSAGRQIAFTYFDRGCASERGFRLSRDEAMAIAHAIAARPAVAAA